MEIEKYLYINLLQVHDGVFYVSSPATQTSTSSQVAISRIAISTVLSRAQITADKLEK